MAKMLLRQLKGDGLLLKDRRCRCPDCYSRRVPRGSVRLARHAAKRAERREWIALERCHPEGP